MDGSSRAPMTAQVRIAVAGALGRMGQAVIAAVGDAPGTTVTGEFDKPELADRGRIASREEAIAGADVVIDFTTPEASRTLAETTAGRGGPALVGGATGVTPEQSARLAKAAERVVIVHSGNFSVGVTLLVGLVEQAARLLPAQETTAPQALRDIAVRTREREPEIDADSVFAKLKSLKSSDA